MRTYSKLPLAFVINRALPRKKFHLSEQQIDKLKTYSDLLLAVLAASGIALTAVVAPKALQALELFQKKRGRAKFKPQESRKKLVRSFYYLKERGHIEFRPKGEDYEVILTKKGRKEIRKLHLDSLAVPRADTWDGKFWQIAADIPTKTYRRGADLLRQKLKDMEFYPLQRTLWFYPYDPRIELEFITRSFGIDSFVTVMKIEQLDPSDEKILKGFFKESGII